MKWITKNRSFFGNVTNDVSLRFIRSGTEKKALNITIRNGYANKISSTGFAVVGVDRNRIYFAEANKETGYKLVENSTSRNKYLSISKPVFPELVEGDYEMYRDESNKLFYISVDSVFCNNCTNFDDEDCLIKCNAMKGDSK